ncbi:ORF3 [Grizzly bear anellovirus 7]|nr:ORF3 [Grizzly bear anellovirus 7]
MIFGFSLEDGVLDTKDNPGQSKKQTSASPVHKPKETDSATPASILKKTSTSTASSEKKLFRELLALITPGEREPWRSSPSLFISETPSERRGYRGRMKRGHEEVYTSPSDSELSGIFSQSEDEDGCPVTKWQSWDSEDEEEDAGRGGGPPPNTPPRK